MKKEILISVIIPIYNAEKTLKKSVDSVLHQTYTCFELILVDDGSTDSSGKMCDEYVHIDKRVKVIHQKNAGVSHARNIGLDASDGEYVMFLDSDDEMDPTLLEENLKIIDELNPDVLIFNFRYVFSDHYVNNGFKQEGLFFGEDKRFFEEKLETVVEKELMNAPWNKLIRRNLIDDNKVRFDERFSILEDAIFSLTVCVNAKTLCVNSNIYYSYNLWETGSLRTKWSENRFMAIKELYKLEKGYCSKYKDNKKQIEFFGKIFCNSIYAYLQMVSVNRELSSKKKQEQLKIVCNDDIVRKVFINKKYNLKMGMNKKIIRFFVRKKMTKMIMLLYKLKNIIRKK